MKRHYSCATGEGTVEPPAHCIPLCSALDPPRASRSQGQLSPAVELPSCRLCTPQRKQEPQGQQSPGLHLTGGPQQLSNPSPPLSHSGVTLAAAILHVVTPVADVSSQTGLASHPPDPAPHCTPLAAELCKSRPNYLQCFSSALQAPLSLLG